MEFRSGPTSAIIAPLLILLAFSGTAAAPSSVEKAYRDARAIADVGDRLRALVAAETALKTRGTADDEWTVALRILRGEMLIKSGLRRDEGLAIVAPPLPVRLRTSEAAVRRLLALGFASKEPGKYFEEALAIAETHQPKLVVDVRTALVSVAPNLEAAEAHARIAMTLARKNHNELALAVVENGLSYKYSLAQRYAKAIALGEDAIRTFRKLGVQGRLSSACGNLGWPYLELGDYERAEELFKCAINSARTAGYSDHEVIWMNHLANLQFARRRFVDAEREYARALVAARRLQSTDIPAMLTNLARVAIETKRYADATRFNAEALQLKRAQKDDDGVQRSLIIDARIAMAESRAADAEKTFRGVIAASTQQAVQWEAQARLAQLYALLKRNADAEASFRKAMSTVRAARGAITSDELRLSFYNVAAEVSQSYVDYLVSLGRVEEALNVTEDVRARTLEEGVGAKPQDKPTDPRAVARTTGATILSYWLGDARSYVWTISPTSVTIQPLPAKDVIEASVEKYRHALSDAPGASLRALGADGAALYRMLVEPALPGVAKNARIIVIADGNLHAINFETLVVGDPQHYWIEDVILSSAASLQLLARDAAKSAAAPSMLIVGNPPRSDPAYPPLLHAQEEVDKIANRFAHAEKLTGPKATPAAYHAIAPGKFDYVHFVAHGVATRTRPLDSAVILGRDATREYRLFARDIVSEPLNARLVTISSCHGAGTRVYAGEGLVGLAWAFLRAGAGNVIAGLWEVDDSATPDLMDRMYAGIRAGRDPAVALRDAKLVLVRGQGAYRRPLYWAPFVLYAGS